ncbi:MAG: T9SS type A sorting domain-containing protein, partial [Saprospiraceae bacterium]
ETIRTPSYPGKSPSIHFYPNPTKEWVIIETEISPEQMIQVYDTKGNLVKNQRVQSVTKQSFRVDLSGLPTGQYFIGWKEMDVKSMIAVLKW